jgi:hypothetical protein
VSGATELVDTSEAEGKNVEWVTDPLMNFFMDNRIDVTSLDFIEEEINTDPLSGWTDVAIDGLVDGLKQGIRLSNGLTPIDMEKLDENAAELKRRAKLFGLNRYEEDTEVVGGGVADGGC